MKTNISNKRCFSTVARILIAFFIVIFVGIVTVCLCSFFSEDYEVIEFIGKLTTNITLCILILYYILKCLNKNTKMLIGIAVVLYFVVDILMEFYNFCV